MTLTEDERRQYLALRAELSRNLAAFNPRAQEKFAELLVKHLKDYQTTDHEETTRSA